MGEGGRCSWDSHVPDNCQSADCRNHQGKTSSYSLCRGHHLNISFTLAIHSTRILVTWQALGPVSQPGCCPCPSSCTGLYHTPYLCRQGQRFYLEISEWTPPPVYITTTTALFLTHHVSQPGPQRQSARYALPKIQFRINDLTDQL